MYSRSYNTERQIGKTLPSGYDGCAFSEEKSDENLDTPPILSERDGPCAHLGGEPGDAAEASARPSSSGGFLSGIFSSFLGGGGFNLRLPRIGTEEILIIATALFLLFSKEGDTECALLLLLLLLIN